MRRYRKITLREKADLMRTVELGSQVHVIVPDYNRSPNYLMTGRAFVAILKPGETLEDFRDYWIRRKTAIDNEDWQGIKQIERQGEPVSSHVDLWTWGDTPG